MLPLGVYVKPASKLNKKINTNTNIKTIHDHFQTEFKKMHPRTSVSNNKKNKNKNKTKKHK